MEITLTTDVWKDSLGHKRCTTFYPINYVEIGGYKMRVEFLRIALVQLLNNTLPHDNTVPIDKNVLSHNQLAVSDKIYDTLVNIGLVDAIAIDNGILPLSYVYCVKDVDKVKALLSSLSEDRE